MSDPFSIATGALGLLSLAASITKTLYTYTSSVKSCSSTISQIRTHTCLLSHILADVGPVLLNPTVEENEKELIALCISNCEDNFLRLEKMLKPFMNNEAECDDELKKGDDDAVKSSSQRQNGDAKSEGFRNKLRKLTWPFREKETKELLDILDRTVQQLGVALDTVNSKTSLTILTLTQYQSLAIEETQLQVESISSQTREISSILTENTTTLSRIDSTASTIENWLRDLEDRNKVRETETQKLLLRLLDKFESDADLGLSETTQSADPLAREIMRQTFKREFGTKFKGVGAHHLPEGYSFEGEKYSTTSRNYSLQTPFGRISILSSYQEHKPVQGKSVVPKGKASSKYKLLFTPAAWLYSHAAALSFTKKADGIGINITTPAIFKKNDPVLKYLRRGDYRNLQLALSENGFLINAVHEETGRTLLAEAVRCRRLTAIRHLLSLGADPETCDHKGSTLFNLLFNLDIRPDQITRCYEIFTILTSTRADIFAGNSTVLHSAVSAQYVNMDRNEIYRILKMVCKATGGYVGIDEKDGMGRSPLVKACEFGGDNGVVVDFLLRNGVASGKNSAPATSKVGRSLAVGYAEAFSASARAGYIICMCRLLQGGIRGDTNMKTALGRTILHNNIRRSVKCNHPRKALNSKVSQYEQKQKTWEEGIRYLISKGANINAIDERGWTVLHCATLGPFCDIELLRVLIDCGVDVGIKDKEGRTAWEVAKQFRKLRMGCWRWFGIEMYKKGKLKQADLKGFVSKELFMGNNQKEDNEEGDGDVQMLKLSVNENWMNMDGMHIFESEEVFGEIKKVDEGAKYMIPDDDIYTEPSSRMDDKKENRSWMGTVGNVLAAFVG